MNFTHGPWHAWKGSAGQIMLSHEGSKTLRSFKNEDTAINWLWFSDEAAARALNQYVKENA